MEFLTSVRDRILAGIVGIVLLIGGILGFVQLDDSAGARGVVDTRTELERAFPPAFEDFRVNKTPANKSADIITVSWKEFNQEKQLVYALRPPADDWIMLNATTRKRIEIGTQNFTLEPLSNDSALTTSRVHLRSYMRGWKNFSDVNDPPNDYVFVDVPAYLDVSVRPQRYGSLRAAFYNNTFFFDSPDGLIKYHVLVEENGVRKSLADFDSRARYVPVFRSTPFSIEFELQVEDISANKRDSFDALVFELETDLPFAVNESRTKIGKHVVNDFGDLAAERPTNFSKDGSVRATNTSGKERVFADPSVTVSFVDPTPADAATVTNNMTVINVSIANTTALDYIFLDDNGTNVTIASLNMSYWSLDGGNADDRSLPGHDGTVTGDTLCNSTSSGWFQQGCYFNDDSADGGIDTGDAHDDVGDDNEFTFMAWFRQEDGSQEYIGSQWFGETQWICRAQGTNSVRFFWRDSGTSSITSSTNVYNNNEWNHIACTYKQGTQYIYLNGERVASGTDTGDLGTITDETLWIGSQGGVQGDFGGDIDEVRFYTRYLEWDEINKTMWMGNGRYYANLTNESHGEITYQVHVGMTDGTQNRTERRTLMFDSVVPPWIQFNDSTPADGTTTSNTSIPINFTIYNETAYDDVIVDWNGTNLSLDDPSLVAWFDFDNNTNDLSRYGNDGTQEGNANCSTVVPGKFGSSCHFDGDDDMINIGQDSELLFTNNFSLEAWIYPFACEGDSPGSQSAIISRREGNSFTYQFRLDPGTCALELLTSGGSTTANTGVTLNSWNHAAVVVNSGEVKYYLNGELDATTTPSSINAQTVNTYIGNVGGGAHDYVGFIDEVRIWDRRLSQDEIQSSYLIGKRRLYDPDGFSLNVTNLSVGTYTFQGFINETVVGKSNHTEVRTITIESAADSTVPTFTTPQTNATGNFSGLNVNWTSTISDDTELSFCWFTHNDSGTFTNSTVQSCTTPFVFDETITIASTKGQVCGYFGANDTSNNHDESGQVCADITPSADPCDCPTSGTYTIPAGTECTLSTVCTADRVICADSAGHLIITESGGLPNARGNDFICPLDVRTGGDVGG